MSNVKALADEEAARAEAETPDDDEQEAEAVEGHPVTPPEPDEATETDGPTPDDVKAFRREYARHERELGKIMGDDFALLAPCDACGAMGYAPPPEVRTNEKYIRCDTCNGFGQVLTGSRAPGNETQPCPGCAGRGFLEKLPQAPTETSTANGDATTNAGYGTPAWMGDPSMSSPPSV